MSVDASIVPDFIAFHPGYKNWTPACAGMTGNRYEFNFEMASSPDGASAESGCMIVDASIIPDFIAFHPGFKNWMPACTSMTGNR